MSEWISMDDALRAAEDARESRLERPSPYTVPEDVTFGPARMQLSCWVAGCARKFAFRAHLNAHLVDDHGGK